MPLQKLSRTATVALSLFTWYAPYGWILFVEGRWYWLKIWLVLPGAIVSALFRLLLSFFRIELPAWSMVPLSILFAIGLLAGLLFLMFQFPRARWLTIVGALLLAGLMSWCAYGLYRA